MKSLVITILSLFLIASCNKVADDNKIIYVPVVSIKTDSTYIIKSDSLSKELSLIKDSLAATKKSADSIKMFSDSVVAKLFVANYKLERISKYCDIAKKGNNIKYLRGWIIRTLKD